MPPAIIGGAIAAAGTVGGALISSQGKKDTLTKSPLNMGPESELEKYLSGTSQMPGSVQNNYRDISSIINQGPGSSDVEGSLAATRGYAQMLQDYSQNGGVPTASDISRSNEVARNLFAPQQTALQQNFEDQTTAANRQAAIMGRQTNDPILQAKFRTEQIRQQALLDANQNAFSQNYALQQPFQRLGFAEQRASILGGLATQAIANRSALLQMGQQLQTGDRNFRLAQAGSEATSVSPGNWGIGALAGMGAGLSAANNLGLFSGANATPSTPQSSSSGISNGGLPNSQDWSNWATNTAPSSNDWSSWARG